MNNHTEGTLSISLHELIVPERLRADNTEIRLKIEEELVPSIAELGLIHPITVNVSVNGDFFEGLNIFAEKITSRYVLIAGWSRSVAFSLLGYEHIPANTRDNVPEYTRLELELEENIRRNDMSWQDQVLAIDRIHAERVRLRINYNVGKDKKDKQPAWGLRATGKLLNVVLSDVNNATILAKYLKSGDAEIISAGTIFAARAILSQRKEDEASKLNAKKQAKFSEQSSKIKVKHRVQSETPAVPTAPVVPTTEDDVLRTKIIHDESAAPAVPKDDTTIIRIYDMLYHRDSLYDTEGKDPSQPPEPSFFSMLEDESIDGIYTDPPFAIDMDDMRDRKDIDRVRDTHDVSENLNQMPLFFKHAARVLKDKSYCLFWYDIKHQEKIFGTLKYVPDDRDRPKKGLYYGKWAEKKGWTELAGFTACPYPILWHKTHPCKPAPPCWPTKSFEYLGVARKGTGQLLKPWLDPVVAASGTAERKSQNNPFAKPFEVSKQVIEHFFLPGSTIVDCYAGAGSIVRALLNCNMHVLASEKDEKHYNELVEHVKKHFKTITTGKVVFE